MKNKEGLPSLRIQISNRFAPVKHYREKKAKGYGYEIRLVIVRQDLLCSKRLKTYDEKGSLEPCKRLYFLKVLPETLLHRLLGVFTHRFPDKGIPLVFNAKK
jgi:hypothetical protein